MRALRALGRLVVYALAATMAAGPIVLAVALLPVRVWAVCYLLAMLAVVAAYRWWRAATDRDTALGDVWELRVREQEARQRVDAQWDAELRHLFDTEER